MTPPLLLVRADATPNGGTGHIMRTLAIAQEWIALGGRCIYLCSSLPNKLKLRLTNEKCEIIFLKETSGSSPEVKETSRHVNNLNPQWLLLDSYLFTQKYHQQIELLSNTKLACISDFGTTDFHKPHLAIHSNIQIVGDYSNLTSTTKLLAGIDYILIRKELIKKTNTPPTNPNNNLLISIGGSDPTETTFELCNCIAKSNIIKNYNIRAILGPAYPQDGKMYQPIDHNINIVVSPESMLEHYQWADSLIYTPSTTAFEALHHNVSLGLVTIADNQAALGVLLSELNLAILLADTRETNSPHNNYKFNSFFDTDNQKQMKKKNLHLIDGQGASRICKYMLNKI